MRFFRLGVLLTLLLVPMCLTAQERVGAIEIEPFLGDFSQVSGDRLKDANLWGLNVGFMFSDRFSLEADYTHLVNQGEDGDIYDLRGLYHFQPDHKVVPYLFAGLGQVSLFDKNDMLFEYGAGVKYSLTDLIGVRGDVKQVLSGNDWYKNSFAFTLGLTFQIGGASREPVVVELAPDLDNDGVRDSLDYCWNTPPSSKVWKMVVDSRGCALDEDKNGIPDYKDDADGDGVINYADECAATPKGWPVDEKGCPKDSDGEGLMDGREMELGTDPMKADTDGDKCNDFDEVEKYRTDPLKADTDGDGLTDCDEIFTYKTDPLKADTDSDGFNDGEEVLTYKSDPNVAGDAYANIFGEKSIFFNLDKFAIRKDAAPVLDEIAQFMAQYGAANLHITGNTCDLNSEKYNMKLSIKRANTARDYLVKKGVPADRITTEGKGESEPRYDNKTKDGREKNRRDDFIVK
jgi:OOP family OmpA-OmpF porin